jgi:hypothetical protein
MAAERIVRRARDLSDCATRHAGVARRARGRLVHRAGDDGQVAYLLRTELMMSTT